MKNWHQTLLGIFVGVILSAAFFLIASAPRGAAVELMPAPTPAPILIHVDGAVRNPGVYPLEQGSRVRDAVLAAGGLGDKANSSVLNLAAGLKDGDKLHIPAIGTPLAPVTAATGTEHETEPDGSIGPVNINTADEETLSTLPGIGTTRAQQIIAYREQHGGFKTIEEILEISGIGPASFERLKELITVEAAIP